MSVLRNILRALLPILVLVVAVFMAKQLVNMRKQPETRPPEAVLPLVNVVRAELGKHRISVSAQGTVLPRTASDLVAEVAGRVLEMSPALVSGGFFEEGELLLRIDARDYELAVSQAELEIARAERRLAEEQADAALARREWESLGEGEPTPLTFREPQMAEAQANLKSAKVGLERAQRDLDRTSVRAPYSGRVREKQVDLGQFVQRGTHVARVYAVDFAEVRLPIPDADLEYLELPLGYRGESDREGPEVTLSATFAGKLHHWSGRIVRTEGEIDSRSRMVMAVAQVENPYGRTEDMTRPPLAVGMFVQARILGRRLDDVVVLPRQVLRGGDRVYVMDAEERLRVRQIEILSADRESVVVGSGLAQGELVIISPLEIVTDGTRLRLWQPLDQSEDTGAAPADAVDDTGAGSTRATGQ